MTRDQALFHLRAAAYDWCSDHQDNLSLPGVTEALRATNGFSIPSINPITPQDVKALVDDICRQLRNLHIAESPIRSIMRAAVGNTFGNHFNEIAPAEWSKAVWDNGGFIGLFLRTHVEDQNDVDGVGEVKIPVGHTGHIGDIACEGSYAVEWDDLDGKPAGWTIWDQEELLRDAELSREPL